MSFIDNALAARLTADEFLQAMGNIQNEPAVRETLSQYPQWIQDVIQILDYDAELTAEGLENREYTPEIAALKRAGIEKEAGLLSMVHDNSDYAAMSAIYPRLACLNEEDYAVFWNCLKAYISKNLT